ncbi:ABC transporter permease [Candidatus Bipolaricaulota bacterium]|nr:ABC transporter permease [Candidatus Bipolaricaulota bacterium]
MLFTKKILDGLTKLSPILKREKLLAVGLVVVLIFIIVSIFAPYIAPYDPITYRSAPRLSPPSVAHPMGTDQLQRDVLSRVLNGARAPLIVAFASIALSMSVGTILGLISGYIGSFVDRVLSVTMDALYSFPSIILAIVLVAVLEPGVDTMIFAISIVYIPTYFRVTRSEVLTIREETFVEAVNAMGASGFRILFKHIAPNVVNAIMAISSFNIADAILTEASLSYLGYGLPPPTPDWGFDIQNGQKFLQSGYWWLVTFPGIMIIILSLGFGLVGEGVSDLLNPKRKRKKA